MYVRKSLEYLDLSSLEFSNTFLEEYPFVGNFVALNSGLVNVAISSSTKKPTWSCFD